jgi:restriction system protein
MEIMKISEHIQSLPHGKGPNTEVDYRLAWARTYLGKVEALTNSERGVWALTQYGRNLTEEDVNGIPSIVRERSRKERTTQVKEKKDECGEELSAKDNWKESLLSMIKKMTPDAFERLAQLILRESGFIKVDVTGRSGDGGIDGIGVLKIKLVTFQVLFQCKRYKGTVSASAIRDFRGAMQGRTDKGLFITTGRFTPDAKKEASRDGAPTIDLIDGELLCDLLKELKIGVETKMVEEVEIKPDFFGQI